MRTNIEIDDALLKEAMTALGSSTKRAAIDQVLQDFVLRIRRRRAIEKMRGMGWEGDLDQMRDDWTPDADWGLDRR